MTVCSNFIYKGGKIEKKSQSAKYPHGEKSRLYRKSQVKKSAYIESVGVLQNKNTFKINKHRVKLIYSVTFVQEKFHSY